MTNNRIAFIDYQKAFRFGSIEAEAPIGFAFLSHSLKKAGFETRLFSYWEGIHQQEDFFNDLIEYKPMLIGANGTFAIFAADIIKIIEPVKRACPEITVLFGGIAVTNSPEAYLSSPLVDYVCLGEGEKAMTDLCKALRDKQEKFEIPGIYDKHDIGKRQKEIQYIDDLDDVDMDLELLDWNSYTTENGASRTLWSLQSSRGCPFACNFCYRSRVRIKYRLFPEEKFIKWVDYVHAKSNCNAIRLIDDHFFVNKERSKRIITALQTRKIKLETLDIRMEDISDELMAFAAQNNVLSMFVGLESPIDRILNMMNKKTSRKLIDDALIIIRRYPDILFYAQIMLAIPGMTKKDIKDSIKFAIKSIKNTPNLFLHFVVFIPLPGSKWGEEIGEKWKKYQFNKLTDLSDIGEKCRLGLEWLDETETVKQKIYQIPRLFELFRFIRRARERQYQSPLPSYVLYLYEKVIEFRLRHLKFMNCEKERIAINKLFKKQIGSC